MGTGYVRLHTCGMNIWSMQTRQLYLNIDEKSIPFHQVFHIRYSSKLTSNYWEGLQTIFQCYQNLNFSLISCFCLSLYFYFVFHVHVGPILFLSVKSVLYIDHLSLCYLLCIIDCYFITHTHKKNLFYFEMYIVGGVTKPRISKIMNFQESEKTFPVSTDLVLWHRPLCRICEKTETGGVPWIYQVVS